MTDWIEIRIMYPSEETCLWLVVSVRYHYEKIKTMCVGPVQSVHHHFHRHVTCSRHEISHIFLTRRSTTITLPLIRLRK